MTPQEKSMNLARIAQEKNNLCSEAFEKRLHGEYYQGEITQNWREAVTKAVLASSPLSNQISLKDYARVMEVVVNRDYFTLFELGVLCNCVESVSCNQLGLTPSEYFTVITETLSHIMAYNKIVNEIKDEIQLQVDKDYQMKVATDAMISAGEA